jgi:hypothetical protein
MLAFTSTSEFRRKALKVYHACWSAFALCASLAPSALAQQAGPPGTGAPPPKEEKKAPTKREEDFSTTPWTEYGEFNEEEEEVADTRFFQFGRFFGASIGAGVGGALGNRGLLWQGGFPSVDLKIHYWFDFNLAMDLGFNQASFFYERLTLSERVDIRTNFFGASVKYYIPTQDLSSAIGFAGPYFLIGVASYTKDEVSSLNQGTTSDSQFGFNAGAGLEFVLSHRKVYLSLEGRAHSVPYLDSTSKDFITSNGITDLSGLIWNTSVGLLFTW